MDLFFGCGTQNVNTVLCNSTNTLHEMCFAWASSQMIFESGLEMSAQFTNILFCKHDRFSENFQQDFQWWKHSFLKVNITFYCIEVTSSELHNRRISLALASLHFTRYWRNIRQGFSAFSSLSLFFRSFETMSVSISRMIGSKKSGGHWLIAL